MNISNYEKALSKLHSDILFLMVTATDRETFSLLEELSPLDNYDEVEKCFVENGTYHIGKLGIYNVIHVQCGSMGAVGRDSSVNTVSDAIRHWNPNAIIMVGIAFGMDAQKQQIGDVLVSQAIVNYESARISKSETIYRGNIPESGKLLLNRFQNMFNWNFVLEKGRKARKHVGLIVSGEKLVDNNGFKNNLKQSFPNAIGGEMEGFGVYSASANAGINEWIIVKAICDWADGNKNENKSEYQQIAAESAVSLCKAVMSEKAFADLEKRSSVQDAMSSNSLYTNLLPIESRYTINVSNNKLSFFHPQHVFNGSNRSKLVKSICGSINQYKWINLWGNVWSGKSQLLLLLSEQVSRYYWIDLKNKNPDEAFQTLLQLLISSIDYKIIDENHLITTFLNNFEENTVFLIDDIPILPRDHKLLNLLLNLCHIGEQRQIRLVTTGNQKLTSIVRNDCMLHAINIPPMNEEEVKEILQHFKAPDRILDSKVNTWLAATNGRTPAIIMALIKYLEDNNWNINNNVFDAIIYSNAGEVSFELQRLINHTIPNEETRELLYRIAIVGHEIPQDYIPYIASTFPPVQHTMERMNELFGQWVLLDNEGQYNVPSSIKNIAEKNVSYELKKQVSLVVAEQIIKKRTLNQFDVTRLIGHFLQAEQYDDAGNVYIRALWELDNSDYTYDPFMFTTFWSTLPLPIKMNDDLKCRIRILQIKVFSKLNKDISFAIENLIECSEKQESLYYYLLIGAATIGLSNTNVALDLFHRALIKGVNIDFHGSDSLPMNIMSGITFLTVAQIKDLAQLKKWFENLKLINFKLIEEACEHKGFYASIFIAVERVLFKAIEPTSTKKLLIETREVFSKMQEYGQKSNWLFFYALAAREQLQLINTHDSYQEAGTFYMSTMLTCKDNQLSGFLITSMMSIISSDKKDYEYAKRLIKQALTFEVNEDYLLLEKVNLHLTLSSILDDEDPEKSIEETQKALDIVVPTFEWGLAYNLKIYGEHLINIYLHGRTKQYINLYYEVAKLLLENEQFDGREEIIAIWCHVLIYIVNDIVYNTKPMMYGEEEYVSPRRRIFINDKASEWFLNNHSEDKLYFALFLISDLLSFYGKIIETQEIIREAVIQKSILPETNVRNNMGLAVLVSPFIWLQTIQCNMIPDAFNLLNSAYDYLNENTPSNDVFKDFLTMHFFMITVSFINKYIEASRDSQAKILKSFQTEIINFCNTYKSFPLAVKYKEMIMIFINNNFTSNDLLNIGNNFKTSFPELQVMAYLLSTAELPITQSTLQIQINTLQYISFRIKPNDAFYRIEYLQYLKNTWLNLLNGENRLNSDLNKAKRLMSDDAVITPKLKDIKHVLKLLKNGCNVQLEEEITKWLFD